MRNIFPYIVHIFKKYINVLLYLHFLEKNELMSFLFITNVSYVSKEICDLLQNTSLFRFLNNNMQYLYVKIYFPMCVCLH